MHWMTLTLASAFFLGLYDLAKKVSVRGNAVPIVLLLSVSVGCLFWGVLLILQAAFLTPWLPSWLSVHPIDRWMHLALAAKAILVGGSWTLAFYSLKHLPLSIAAPIRSTSPLWTIVMAVLFLAERPTSTQWIGLAIVLGSFWALSWVGAREGIRFTRNIAVGWMILATILGAISSIYDKVLLQEFKLSPATVQAWFSVYLLPVMLPLAWHWQRTRGFDEQGQPTHPFEFRWSILLISPLLLAADMTYFSALADTDALVSIVSPLRRCSVIVAMLLGSRMVGEVNLKAKLLCVIGLLIGVALLM